MWIDAINISGFGCITNRRYEFPRGKLSLIVDENERGKSTLAAAIVTALCGFPTKRPPKGMLKPIDAFRPWFGESYSVELEFEAGGICYRVVRDFSNGRFAVYDLRTNRDVSAHYDADLAYHFLRLPREDYERIAVISGKEVSYFNPSATIRERLTAVIEGSQHSAGAEKALEILDSAVYRLDSRDIKPKTAISRINETINEKSRELSELDSALEAVSEDVEALERLRAKQDELKMRLAELETEYATSRLAEITKEIATVEQDLAQRAKLTEEMKQLEKYASFPAERREQILNAITRMREIQNQIAERKADARRIGAEADELRNRVNARKQFSGASREDLLRLYRAREKVSSAATALEESRAALQAARSDRLYVLGKLLLLVGLVLSAAAFTALLTGAVQSRVGAEVIIATLAISAVGLWLYLHRYGMQVAAEARIRQAERDLQQISTTLTAELSLFGIGNATETELIALLEKTARELEIYLEDQAKLANTQRDLASLERMVGDLYSREKQEQDIIESILREADIDVVDSLDQALLLFKQGCEQYERYWQIKKSDLPNLESRIISDAELSRLREEAEKLKQQIGGAPSPDSCRSSLEVDADRQNTLRELDEVRKSIGDLEHKIGFAVENYKRKYPAARAELQQLNSELRRATRFARALELATTVLGEVVAEARLRWADALNRRASLILPHLNPDYEDLRFDDSLAFTIRRVSDGRLIEKTSIDACLSTGAKDQVYLAVRLACCRELSAGSEALPIILDDALMSFDDERFEAAARYIVDELSKDQQVIMLTCHRARHERLSDRDWFRNGVAILDLD
ncbi:MAG: AAA family ATPase [Armatimonadota bacterium]|nr:AAA family ATPase [Armatimonadota bacterium]